MEWMSVRKRLQGVTNIIRFNWHFYLIGLLSLALLVIVWTCLGSTAANAIVVVAIVAVSWNLFVSLAVSAYVYDFSGFYTLTWLRRYLQTDGNRVANVHAGFDETSGLIAGLHPMVSLSVYDFYDAARHTEVSIRRARAAYGAYPGTTQMDTRNAVLADGTYDLILLILAAHEIRSEAEAVSFFSGLKDHLAHGGRIIVVEHLRDTANFMAYTIGFFHFLSRRRWLRVFNAAGLVVEAEEKINPFISLFCLSDGTRS